MTIEQAMQKIVALAGSAVAYAREGSTPWAEQAIEDLETILTTLVAQARDEEAAECAHLIDVPDQAYGDQFAQTIRARIAARKGA